MRSHVTAIAEWCEAYADAFQYRKRYEITCDFAVSYITDKPEKFQYRKRYEITCDPYRK